MAIESIRESDSTTRARHMRIREFAASYAFAVGEKKDA
jgi:hypothetical protein